MGALKSRDLTSRDLTTRHHVPFADFAFLLCYSLKSRKTTELYVKVFQRVQQLVPQFAPTCAMADFEEASVVGFFLDNRLCQITVQTFSIIIATFPSANTYLCCWRCFPV